MLLGDLQPCEQRDTIHDKFLDDNEKQTIKRENEDKIYKLSSFLFLN